MGRLEFGCFGLWGVDEEGHESLVRFPRERLCKEVRKIVLAAAPLYVKMAVVHVISNPMVTHVNRFCPLCLDSQLPCLLHTGCRKESMLELAGSPCWPELGVSIHLPGRE